MILHVFLVIQTTIVYLQFSNLQPHTCGRSQLAAATAAACDKRAWRSWGLTLRTGTEMFENEMCVSPGVFFKIDLDCFNSVNLDGVVSHCNSNLTYHEKLISLNPNWVCFDQLQAIQDRLKNQRMLNKARQG